MPAAQRRLLSKSCGSRFIPAALCPCQGTRPIDAAIAPSQTPAPRRAARRRTTSDPEAHDDDQARSADAPCDVRGLWGGARRGRDGTADARRGRRRYLPRHAVEDPYRWLENGATPPCANGRRASRSARAPTSTDCRYAPGCASASRPTSASPRRATSAARRRRTGLREVLRPEAAAAVAARARHGARSGQGAHRARPEHARPERGRPRSTGTCPPPTASSSPCRCRRAAARTAALHVFDSATGARVGEVIPRVNFPTGRRRPRVGGDGRGFWYTRYPGAGATRGRPSFLRAGVLPPARHRPGAGRARVRRRPAEDRGDPARLFARSRGAAGVGAERRRRRVLALRRRQGRPLPRRSRASRTAWTSRRSAPTARCTSSASATRRAARSSSWRRASPTSPGRRRWSRPAEDAIPINFFGEDPLCFVGDRLYVRYLAGGPTRLRAFALDGKPAGEVPLPEVAAVDEFEPVGDDLALQRRDLPHAGPLLPPRPAARARRPRSR